MNTPSAQATAGQCSSYPSWNSCSLLGALSYPWKPQSIISTKRLGLSSPWTTRKMSSEVRLSESPAACPVRAGVNIFLCLREIGCDPTTPISNFPTAQGLHSVSTSNIIAVIRDETQRVGAARLGLAPEDAGTHSLCSGGAMAMHIAGVPYRTLVAIGRWRLLGFMVYI